MHPSKHVIADAPSLYLETHEATLNELADLGTAADHPAGTLIVRQGALADSACLLLRGAARMVVTCRDGRESTLSLARAPVLFGEAECLNGLPYQHSVALLRGGHVVHIDREVLRGAVTSLPSLGQLLLRASYARAQHATWLLASQAFCSVEERLAALILAYAEILGDPVQGYGIQIPTPDLTYETLAADLSVATKSIQRAIAQWMESGTIAREGKYYVIRKPEALREMGNKVK